MSQDLDGSKSLIKIKHGAKKVMQGWISVLCFSLAHPGTQILSCCSSIGCHQIHARCLVAFIYKSSQQKARGGKLGQIGLCLRTWPPNRPHVCLNLIGSNIVTQLPRAAGFPGCHMPRYNPKVVLLKGIKGEWILGMIKSCKPLEGKD